jgi:hypothetical protein
MALCHSRLGARFNQVSDNGPQTLLIQDMANACDQAERITTRLHSNRDRPALHRMNELKELPVSNYDQLHTSYRLTAFAFV